MAHWIHGVIGRPSAVARLGDGAALLDAGFVWLPWPEKRVREVEDEAAEHEYLDAAGARALSAASGAEGLALIETRYFGGAGGQVGSAWRDGALVVDRGTVNAALRAVGVVRAEGARDEWETVGLSRLRG